MENKLTLENLKEALTSFKTTLLGRVINKTGGTMSGPLSFDKQVGTVHHMDVLHYRNTTPTIDSIFKITLPQYVSAVMTINIRGIYESSINTNGEFNISITANPRKPINWAVYNINIAGWGTHSSIKFGKNSVGNLPCILLYSIKNIRSIIISDVIVDGTTSGWDTGWVGEIITDESGLTMLTTDLSSRIHIPMASNIINTTYKQYVFTDMTFTPAINHDNGIIKWTMSGNTLINEVNNPKFKMGIDNWVLYNSTMMITDNTAINTGGDGTTNSSWATLQQTLKTKLMGPHGLFLYCRVRVTNNLATSISVEVGSSTKIINSPVLNQWYDVSIETPNATHTVISITHQYNSISDCNGSSLEIDCTVGVVILERSLLYSGWSGDTLINIVKNSSSLIDDIRSITTASIKTIGDYQNEATIKMIDLKSLPNGKAVDMVDSDCILTQNISELTIIDENDMLAIMPFSDTLDIITISYDAISTIISPYVYDSNASKMMTNMTVHNNTTDGTIINTWRHFFDTSYWGITVPKNHYPSIESARSDIGGNLKVQYMLATPIIQKLDIIHMDGLLYYYTGNAFMSISDIVPSSISYNMPITGGAIIKNSTDSIGKLNAHVGRLNSLTTPSEFTTTSSFTNNTELTKTGQQCHVGGYIDGVTILDKASVVICTLPDECTPQSLKRINCVAYSTTTELTYSIRGEIKLDGTIEVYNTTGQTLTLIQFDSIFGIS
jgi:hypothetical protein